MTIAREEGRWEEGRGPVGTEREGEREREKERERVRGRETLLPKSNSPRHPEHPAVLHSVALYRGTSPIRKRPPPLGAL